MPAPRHVTASGTHYAREGEGPALVFIHGAGGNAAAWFQQVEAFARDYCVLCIDLPGFGQTLPRQLANTTESLAHVVLEVLDHAGFESSAGSRPAFCSSKWSSNSAKAIKRDEHKSPLGHSGADVGHSFQGANRPLFANGGNVRRYRA